MNEVLWVVTPQAIEQYASAVENMDPVFFSSASSKEIGFDRQITPTSFCAQYQMFQDPSVKVIKGGVHTKQRMSFYRPIQAGDYIYAKTEAQLLEDAKGRPTLIYITTFVNQNDEIVCRGEMTNLLPCKKP